MIVNREQVQFLQGLGVSIVPSEPLSDEECAVIEETVSDFLQRKGFDQEYEPTEDGRLCEAILDRLAST